MKNLIHLTQREQGSQNFSANRNSTKNRNGRYSFVMSNKHFFHGSHRSLSIIDKSNFIKYYDKLTKYQKLVLYGFFEALNNNKVYNVSEVKRTIKEKISYVTVTFGYKHKTFTRDMFYFFGLTKLLSFRGKAKFSLSLKELITLAREN